MPDRKPLAAAESRDAKSVRYAPSEWQLFVTGAILRDSDPSKLARECSLIGITVLNTPPLLEAYCRLLSATHLAPDVAHSSHATGKSA